MSVLYSEAALGRSWLGIQRCGGPVGGEAEGEGEGVLRKKSKYSITARIIKTDANLLRYSKRPLNCAPRRIHPFLRISYSPNTGTSPEEY